MKVKAITIFILLFVAITFACTKTKETADQTDAASKTQPATAQKITIEEAKKILDASEVVTIDVRKAGDWINSDSKIAGAVREDPTLVDSWYDKYPKEKTIILYCS